MARGTVARPGEGIRTPKAVRQVQIPKEKGDSEYDRAAATVAPSEAQGEDRAVCALPGQKAVGDPPPAAPCADDQGAFRGGGHDPSESRMREIRTSGLMSGGEETWPR